MLEDENTVAEYKYDFAGRRVAKTVGSTTTTFLYDGDQIIQEYRDGYGRWKTYYYGPGVDELIRMIGWENPGEPGLSYYYDGLGNVVDLADYMGNVVEKYSYDVFGKPTIKGPSDEPRATSSYGNRFMFTGREYDTETGNYYYRARFYKTSIGRFLQPDPITMLMQYASVQQQLKGKIPGTFLTPNALKQFIQRDPIGRFIVMNTFGRLLIANRLGVGIELNLYSYCLNDPFNWIDPYGMFRWGQFFTGVGQVVGGIAGVAFVLSAGATTGGIGAAVLGGTMVASGLSFGSGAMNIVGAFTKDTPTMPNTMGGYIDMGMGGDGKKGDLINDLATGDKAQAAIDAFNLAVDKAVAEMERRSECPIPPQK